MQHAAGLDADCGQSLLDQAAVQIRRQRPGFQTSQLQRCCIRPQKLATRFGLAGDLALGQNLAPLVNHAHRGRAQLHIQSSAAFHLQASSFFRPVVALHCGNAMRGLCYLVKTGVRLLKHARHYWLLLAEGHLTRRLFGGMLHRIAMLPSPAG